ncbi:MAG: DUF4942 domain-containing protein [Prolixibacteraceae bacterium]
MFDPEFYPTPRRIIDLMVLGLDLNDKTVLEPSAGKGDIVDYVKKLGAKVIACEKDADLQKIVGGMCRFLKPDFFDVTAEEVSHVDCILMNPPFSNADRHIQHAWDIAPEGCQIIALCNVETLKNSWSTRREVLAGIIEKNGNWRDIGDAFSTAERKTDAKVALVNLLKPKTGEDEFSNYFFDAEDDDEQSAGAGIMKHNDIREIVNRYVGAVRMFESVMASNKAINNLINPISSGLNISFGAHNTRDRYTSEITRDVFKKELQKSAWRSVFDKMKMDKYVTSGVMADVNKFVEQQQHIPFTMSNIFKMLEIIFGTHAGRMDKALVEVFDRICSLSADNSEAGEKWKTNSNYKVNRRFIDTYICEHDNRWPSDHVKIRIGSRSESLIEDAVKALCFITGKNYDDVMYYEYIDSSGDKQRGSRKSLYNFFHHEPTLWGQWVQWNDFFRIRGYKKGTMHFEFIDENVWMEFNRRVSKIKGWAIPQKTNSKTKGTERTKTAGLEIFH